MVITAVYLCIDLKSFYASVECIDRGYDPFKVNLVVADPTRGDGAITLASSPAIKSLGVKNRCRLFEIPKDIEYEIAMPRMKRYMEVSAQIYSIYLEYISPDDIHVYSVDEVFIDATPYLKMYGMKPASFARLLTGAVKRHTGICATVGIGTNMYLAKVAMDIIAKHTPSHMGYLNEEIYRRQLWHHRPMTDFWNVGHGTAARLEKFHAYDMYDVTQLKRELLFKEFGVKAEFLIDHAWGNEPCTMTDIHSYIGKNRSLSNSQILFRDYSAEEALLVLKEMSDELSLEMMENQLYAKGITLFIRYSKNKIRSDGGRKRLDHATCSRKKIRAAFEELFWEKITDRTGIRQIGISLIDLTYAPETQISFFDAADDDSREETADMSIIDIRHRFGKNSVMKAMDLCEAATGIERHMMVGGHNG